MLREHALLTEGGCLDPPPDWPAGTAKLLARMCPGQQTTVAPTRASGQKETVHATLGWLPASG